MTTLRREDSTDIYKALIESQLSRRGLVWGDADEREDAIIKFVSTNGTVLDRLQRRQINALRTLARDADSIERMKAFLERKLSLAPNAWHHEVEDTFADERKSYNPLATVLIKRLDAYAQLSPGEPDGVVNRMTDLLEQVYSQEPDAPLPETLTFAEQDWSEIQLLLGRRFLYRLADAALLNKPEEDSDA
jgi:hypothetical protein